MNKNILLICQGSQSIQLIRELFSIGFTPNQIQELSYLLRHEIKSLGYPLDDLITPNNRIKKLEKKIIQKRSLKRIYLRRKTSLVKAKLSYLKFILKTAIEIMTF